LRSREPTPAILSGRDHILEHRCASGEEELLEDEAEGAVSGGVEEGSAGEARHPIPRAMDPLLGRSSRAKEDCMSVDSRSLADDGHRLAFVDLERDAP
jgi:hypothetical protein